jgi:MraZ protein
MDSADRILIPKSLLEYGDMDKEVVIFAYNDRMEIWSKAAYEQILAEEPEDFLDLAEEVMGKVRMGEQHTDSD